MKIDTTIDRIAPFNNAVLVEFSSSNVTKGGMLLPDSAMQSIPARVGVVRKVGKGGFFDNGTRRDIGADLKVGDHVMVLHYGLTISVNDVDMELINVDAIMAKV